MKILIALVLVITFMGMNCATYKRGEGINLEPGQKPGAKLVIKKKDGLEIKGELIAVKKDSLLLIEYVSAADVTININEIEVIKLIKKWSFQGLGILAGVAVGFAGGVNIGYHVLKLPSFFGLLIVAVAGAIAGGYLGSRIDSSGTTYQIEEKSDLEIKEILEKLRKEARVPDFQ